MSRKFRILHTDATNGWGGQEIRILGELLWMRERGHELLFAGPAHGHLYQRLEKEGFEVADIHFTKQSQLGDLFRLNALLRRRPVEVLGTHSSVDSWVGLLVGRYRRIPLNIRYRHVSTPVKNKPSSRWQYRSLADGVVTTGEAIANTLRRQFDLSSQRVRSIPTGVSVPETLPGREEARQALASELGLPAQARFIGQVSVLRDWKGHAVLLEAFERLAADFPDHHLAIVGGGEMREAIEAQREGLKARERIHLLGHRDSPWACFRAMDVAVLASIKNEGVPQSGLQAMFSQTPFIGTRVGGIPEICGERERGLLVAPEEARELSDGIRRLLAEPALAEELAGRAHGWVQEVATPDRMGEAIEQLFEDGLEGRLRA